MPHPCAETESNGKFDYKANDILCGSKKSSVKIWRNYLATILDPADNSNTIHSNVPQGIELEREFVNIKSDKCGLFVKLKNVLPWIRNDTYMGQRKVLKTFNVSPRNAAVVLTNYTKCYKYIKGYKELFFRLHLDSYVFEMTFPKLKS